MTDKALITVQNVSKTFRLPHEKHNSIKSLFVNKFRKTTGYEKQQVLKNVSFEIHEGEFFGIVGRNGSGKSTLLKLLAGIYAPNNGAIHVNGKLIPFIELGVGFNPELTGRENVYLNGALLGFSRPEVDSMYDEIVAFAELERFMDQKLKNYSSGMQVRLAFSIAIRARGDILLLDEVLAVGDEAFQQKCLDVFERYKAQKQTVILVTHDMESVKKFCTRAMLIHDGEVVEVGNPRSVARKYSDLNQRKLDKDIQDGASQHESSTYLRAKILDEQLRPKSSFGLNESMIVDFSWHGLAVEQMESIGVSIYKQSGENITGINSRTASLLKNWKEKGELQLEFELNLSPGKYFILIEVFDHKGKVMDALMDGPQFTVKHQQIIWSGLTELPHKWHETR